MPYLTPETTPGGTLCFQVEVPNHPRAISAFYGALLDLADERNWTRNEPTDTHPQEIAYLMLVMQEGITDCASGEPMTAPIGTIVMFASLTPPVGWLLLDGSVVSKDDYPDLWDLWPTALKDPNSLTLASMTDHVARGTDSAPGATGGEDEVQLALSEMPQHSHALQVTAPSTTGTGTGTTNLVRSAQTTGLATYDNFSEIMDTVGGFDAHNNVPVYRAWPFIVKAL